MFSRCHNENNGTNPGILIIFNISEYDELYIYPENERVLRFPSNEIKSMIFSKNDAEVYSGLEEDLDSPLDSMLTKYFFGDDSASTFVVPYQDTTSLKTQFDLSVS